MTHGTLLRVDTAWVGGESGGERIYAHVWPGPFNVHLKRSQHC